MNSNTPDEMIAAIEAFKRDGVVEWTRIRCESCGHIFDTKELLVAKNPFSQDEEINGCPNCKECEPEFNLLCEAPGCSQIASCSAKVRGVMVSTCWDHYPTTRQNEA